MAASALASVALLIARDSGWIEVTPEMRLGGLFSRHPGPATWALGFILQSLGFGTIGLIGAALKKRDPGK